MIYVLDRRVNITNLRCMLTELPASVTKLAVLLANPDLPCSHMPMRDISSWRFSIISYICIVLIAEKKPIRKI